MTNSDIARTILDASRYVVLATADTDGVPWASPVWFATEGYQQLYWVSHPGARHSQNMPCGRGLPWSYSTQQSRPVLDRGCT